MDRLEVEADFVPVQRSHNCCKMVYLDSRALPFGRILEDRGAQLEDVHQSQFLHTIPGWRHRNCTGHWPLSGIRSYCRLLLALNDSNGLC